MKLLQPRLSPLNHLLVGLSTLLMCLISVSAHAATVYASVSKNKVVKNEVFQLTVVSDQKASGDDLDFRALDQDFFMSRPSFSSSMNIINGSRSNRSEWTVSLAANRLGVVTIPSFELHGAKTQPIAIQVTQDEQAPSSDDLVEVRSQLSRSTLYPNESALLKARLIIKADPRRLQDPKIAPPTIDGMELKAASEPNQYQTVMDGIQVTIVDQDFRITASQAGDFTLTEPSLQGALIYGSSYNGGTRILPLKTTPKTYTIHVEPKPADYQGTWLPTSRLTLREQWLDSQGKPITGSHYATKVGDSITREVTVQVTGLTQEQLPNIHLTYPDSVRVYDEKPQFATLDNGDVTMTLKQVLIPRQTGDITLPKVAMQWWDTVTKAQKTASADGLTLSVAAGEPSTVTASTPLPAAPAQVQTVTVNDAGFWPYLTALFALLWLLTLGLAWRWKSSSNVTQQAPVSPADLSAYAQLQQALKNDDGIAISRALTVWMQQVTLTDAETAQLTLALHELNQARYSAQPSTYRSGELKRVVKAIEQQQLKRKKQVKSPLANL
ncbi:BatD family protein [Vibrio furnissii]|uniref:BatD family protein n=1 Tax=Vibrio furnissii TaxID=29494 RepID=UPI001EEA6E88|nr:BatD family protein [Vibrio furnissii]MCG6234201.1 BatD family protein [Vibrio furnissii]MCG6259246.1 BatD family protein [Vibrio furnissii]